MLFHALSAQMYVTAREVNTRMEWVSRIKVHTVVSTDEGISPVTRDTTVGDFFASLQRDVHVAIDGLKVACIGLVRGLGNEYVRREGWGTFIDDARVQLDSHRSSDDFAEKATGISRVTSGFGCWAFAIGGHCECSGE